MKLTNQTTKIFFVLALLHGTNLVCVSKKAETKKFNKDLNDNYRSQLNTHRKDSVSKVKDIKTAHKQIVANIHKDAKKQHMLIREQATADVKNARAIHDHQQRTTTIRDIRTQAHRKHTAINEQKKAKLAAAVKFRATKLDAAHSTYTQHLAEIKKAYGKTPQARKARSDAKMAPKPARRAFSK